MVPGASLTKQHAKTSEMRRSVAMGEIISLASLSVGRAKLVTLEDCRARTSAPRQDPPSSQARTAAKRLNVKWDLP